MSIHFDFQHFLLYLIFKNEIILRKLTFVLFEMIQEAYNNLPVESKVTYLLATICNGTLAEEMRAMAAVLLRRLFSSEFMEFYPKVITEQFFSFLSTFIKRSFVEVLFSFQKSEKIKLICVISDSTRSTSSVEGTNFIISSE